MPILEVQWAAATAGCVLPDDEGCLASEAVVVEAAVPVPILAVQFGDGGTPRDALAALAPLFATSEFATVALAA